MTMYNLVHNTLVNTTLNSSDNLHSYPSEISPQLRWCLLEGRMQH